MPNSHFASFHFLNIDARQSHAKKARTLFSVGVSEFKLYSWSCRSKVYWVHHVLLYDRYLFVFPCVLEQMVQGIPNRWIRRESAGSSASSVGMETVIQIKNGNGHGGSLAAPSAKSAGWRPWWWATPNSWTTTGVGTLSLTSSPSWTWWVYDVITSQIYANYLTIFIRKNMFILFCITSWQVAGIFHDASIGNAIHIVLVRLILLHGDEVQCCWWGTMSTMLVLVLVLVDLDLDLGQDCHKTWTHRVIIYHTSCSVLIEHEMTVYVSVYRRDWRSSIMPIRLSTASVPGKKTSTLKATHILHTMMLLYSSHGKKQCIPNCP